MSNQNKTTIKKTLLLTATMVSFGFLSTAHSAEPELATDEVVESADAIVEDATPELDTSATTEDVTDATTDDLEDAKDADDDSAEDPKSR